MSEHAAPAHEEHGGGGHEAAAEHGGGGGLWKSLTAPVTNGLNSIYGKGKQQFNSLLDPREGAAHSTGFLRGDATEALYDVTIGALGINTRDRLVKVLNQAGTGLENTAIQFKKAFGTTPITAPVALAGNIIQLPVVGINEMADVTATTIGAGYDWIRASLEGGRRAVDYISAQTRDKLSRIPIPYLGKILGVGVSGILFNVPNKILGAPLKVTDWVRGKVGKVLDWSFNKVRHYTIEKGNGAHGGASHSTGYPEHGATDHSGASAYGASTSSSDHGGGEHEGTHGGEHGAHAAAH